MAQLDSAPWTARQTRAQYVAIAWLRWRIWVNSFRRRGGGSELFGQILTGAVALVFLIGPTLLSAWLSWLFVSEDMTSKIAYLLWGIFALSQLVNINLGQPGTTFDPTELIRFPIRLRHYVWIRLFFGLLSPANVMVVAASVAVAAGATVANPTLFTYALPAMLVFALTNIFFTRMVFAWIDRWMSTRRAREVLTAVIFIASLGFQYLNATFNPGLNHNRHVSDRRMATMQHFRDRVQPVTNALPPGLIANSLLSAEANHPATSYTEMAGCAAYGLFFMAIFTIRTRTEFRGENLSDTANVVAAKHLARSSTRIAAVKEPHPATTATTVLGLSPAVFTVFGKEFLYLRRNTGLFYGLIAPMVMVFLFAGRLATRTSSEWLFPTALAYAMMGIAPLAYNSFGLEGTGTQFYFLAPIRLRDVFLGKNLMSLLLGFVEIIAVIGILAYVAAPPTLEMFCVGTCWAIGTALINISIGNLRSVSAPKKINLNRTANKQASPLSALMSLGILIVAAALAAGLMVAGHIFQMQWAVLPIMGAYAAGGFALYLANLRSIERYAMRHRESMFEELCKA